MYVYPLKSANIPGDLKSPLGDLKSPLGDFRSPGKLEIQLRGRSLGQGLGKAQVLPPCMVTYHCANVLNLTINLFITTSTSESNEYMNVQKSIPSINELMFNQQSLWKNSNNIMRELMDFLKNK